MTDTLNAKEMTRLARERMIISADCHLLEPKDLYEKTVQQQLGDRTPHVVRRSRVDGQSYDAWMYNNEEFGAPSSLAAPGRRFENAENFKISGLWEEIDAAAYDPDEFVSGLDLDGVWGALVQPSQGLHWYRIKNSDDLTLLLSVANDFLIDFCSSHPDRLRGVACLNVDDVGSAVKELERSAKKGIVAAFIPVHPIFERRYNDPSYDPLWAAAQDNEIALLLHISTARPGIPGLTDPREQPLDGRRPQTVSAADRVTVSHWVQRSFTDFIFGGVFDRFPRLKVGSSEHEAAWVPHWLRTMDYVYATMPFFRGGWTPKEGMTPSDYWRQNMFTIFMEDPLAVPFRHEIGIDNLLWGNDYPHQESTFPRSLKFLDSFFNDVPAEERKKILSENANRIFRFDH